MKIPNCLIAVVVIFVSPLFTLKMFDLYALSVGVEVTWITPAVLAISILTIMFTSLVVFLTDWFWGYTKIPKLT